MKVGKILGLVVGGFIALAGLLLLSVWLFVDPNAYKPNIVAAVKATTGRDLVLQGNITLAVLPWIALNVGPASLGNPPGFGEQPFVTFQHAAFRARLLPLLEKRLEIGRVEIDGLDVRLARDASGRGNWQDAARPGAPAPGAAAPGAAAPVRAPGGPLPTLAGDTGAGHALSGIAGVKLTHARFSYGAYRVENLNLETGTYAEKELVPVILSFDANRGVAGEQARVDAHFDVSGDFAARLFHVAALTFHGTVNLPDNPRPVRWDFSTPSLDVNLGAQTLSAPAMALEVAGAHLGGSLEGRRILEAAAVSGKMSLEPLVVREFLPRFGLTVPRTRDPRVLSLVTGAFAYGYGPDGATLDDLELTVDDTHITGKAALTGPRQPEMKFALAVDRIDLDRYLAPEGAPSESTPPATSGAAGSAAPAATLDANGTLTVGAVHLTPLDLTDVDITVAASGGVIHLFPLQAQVDGGQYSGNIVLDDRAGVPVLTLDEHLTGIDVGRLAAGGKGVHLSGRGNVTLKASGRGSDGTAVMKSLDGQLDMAVTHGAVEGVDVGFQLGRAEAFLRGQAQPAAADTRRTEFDALKMSAAIENGVARTQDLTLSSAVIKVTGQGSVNLPARSIDLSLLADTLRTAGDTAVQIPIKVTGAVADPTVRPDLEALARGRLGQKVQEVLKDKLKELFNR